MHTSTKVLRNPVDQVTSANRFRQALALANTSLITIIIYYHSNGIHSNRIPLPLPI